MTKNNHVKAATRASQTTSRNQRGSFEKKNWLKIPDEVITRFKQRGLTLRWIRVSLKGTYDDQNVQEKQYEGWDFVRPEDVPEMSTGFQNQFFFSKEPLWFREVVCEARVAAFTSLFIFGVVISIITFLYPRYAFTVV